MMGDTPHELPRVILVTPYYGPVAMGLRQTINMASRDPDLLRVVMDSQASSSVLPKCFNMLLATALDARDAGKVTHLAMAHADITADPGWLDVLWSELWYHQADLIAAVIPIKGPTGRTSTAIGDTADRWRVKRCINLSERATLPATFGPEVVCGPDEVLLVNTGLFLADLRRSWWDDFVFEFHTRLKHTPTGRVAECRSEDWELSHHFHAAGARVLATFKPRLRHEGANQWANYPEPLFT